jgi:RimJ/RimL family protein N-acetyltransferase
MNMREHATKSFRFKDSAVRFVEERDIAAISDLFQLNYRDTYPYLDVYDGRWVKKCIYGDGVICLVIEEGGEVLASGAVLLDYGDYNDQIGEIARIVVHPKHTGKNLGNRIVNALFDTASENVEFAFALTRTANMFSQMVMTRAGFAAIGFLPLYLNLKDKPEHSIPVAKLHGNGASLRSDEPPQIIPEIAPLARHVLSSMNLPKTLSVVEDCPVYADDAPYATLPLDRTSLAKLTHIEHGRLVEPLIFGRVSLEHGLYHIRRHNAIYLMAVDENKEPMGAIGYQHDNASKTVKAIELVAKDKRLRGFLCRSLLREAGKLGAEIIEVNVTAYDARLQRTFAAQGFRPVAYMPAMAFHGTRRLDVVKMLKIKEPYELGEMKLIESAGNIVSIVEQGFHDT